MTMTSAYPDLSISKTEPIMVIGFRERRLVDAAQIARLSSQLTALAEAAPSKPKFLLSFANVEALSSAALGMLTALDSAVRRKFGQLRLADMDSQLYKLFTITKLANHLQILPTSNEAMKSFKL